MNNSFLFLLLLISILASPTVQQQCQQLIDHWLQHPQELPPISYADSGKFLNDFGDYNNCLFHSDQYTFITMKLINILVGYQYMGLCAPNQCSETITADSFASQVQKHMNELYQNKTKTTVQLFKNVHFYIPIQNKPSLDWSNYLVIGLIFTIIVVGIVGSFISYLTQSKSIPVKVIKSFSFWDNFNKIVALPSATQNENLLFLNGMRVLSIFWIVFGHDMWFRFMNIKNWMETIQILQTPGIPTLVPAAYFAVDTFFWIGGFLVTIGLLQKMEKAKNFLKFYFGAILHRFIRIWPTYMLAILIYWKVAPYTSNGPIWLSFQSLANSCSDGGIFWNMLFIDNFEDHGPSGMNYCFGWGWYLAVDFQLFIITPFIIYVYLKNKKAGWIVTLILFLGSVICAFVLILVNDWRYPIPNPKMKPQPQFMDEFYYKPYVRASTYFMGIFSGYLYYEWKNNDETVIRYINKIKKSIPIRILFYVLGIGLCQLAIWVIVPFQTGQDWSTLAQAFYNSLNRVVFLLGVYLCIFAAMFGCKNDPSKYFLGHKIFAPLAKVSFCIYLTHFIVIMNGTFGSKMDLYWEPYSAIYVVICDIVWSIMLATVLSLLVEAPTLGLEKIFLRGQKKKGDNENKKKQVIEFKEQKIVRSSLITVEEQGLHKISPSSSNTDRLQFV